MASLVPVGERAFKLGLRSIAMSVAVVTAQAGSRRNGLAVTSVCSVSADPPTMLACVNRCASAGAPDLP